MSLVMSPKQKLFMVTLLIIGVHSLSLGSLIFFMTESFYEFFFSSEVVNPFFVKQAGLFLILMGFFYLVPLTHVEKLSRVAIVTIITKVCAVVFLFTNAGYSPSPFMMYLAGCGDGVMAIALSITYTMYMKEFMSKSASQITAPY